MYTPRQKQHHVSHYVRFYNITVFVMPLQPLIHTLTAESATQGDGQLVRDSEGEGVSLRDTSTHSS